MGEMFDCRTVSQLQTQFCVGHRLDRVPHRSVLSESDFTVFVQNPFFQICFRAVHILSWKALLSCHKRDPAYDKTGSRMRSGRQPISTSITVQCTSITVSHCRSIQIWQTFERATLFSRTLILAEIITVDVVVILYATETTICFYFLITLSHSSSLKES